MPGPNLVFYCDQATPEDDAIDRALCELLAARTARGRIAYIPSGPEPDRRFFRDRVAYYDRLGLDLALFHDPDSDAAPAGRERLFACDAIHLTGGQTAPFLARLKRSGLMEPLRAWARQGGVLIGTSAGAILMTPTVAVDALFTGDRPEDLADAEALGLVPFEFFPHLGSVAGDREALLRYSRLSPRPILACRDGEGLVLADGRAQCSGQPLWIADGGIRDDAQAQLDRLLGA
jgi:dipeptidase E